MYWFNSIFLNWLQENLMKTQTKTNYDDEGDTPMALVDATAEHLIEILKLD